MRKMTAMLTLAWCVSCTPVTAEGKPENEEDESALGSEGGVFDEPSGGASGDDPPASDDSSSDDGDPEEDAPSDAPGDGEDAIDTGDADSPPVDEPLVSGRWYFDSYSLGEDPCGWNEYLTMFSDGLGPYLPDWFDVEGSVGQFDILGRRTDTSYGSGEEEPVRCDVESGTFECETQVIEPSKGLLGSYGWTYFIDFTGTVQSPNRIEGTSVIRFEVVGSFYPPLEGFPSDIELCTQVLNMELRQR